MIDTRQDQFLLFSKFAHLYDAGVPLAEALDLVRGTLSRDMRQAVGELIEDLYRGTSFADAMARRRDIFSPDLVGVIRAGESRGELGEAARAVAEGLSGNVLGGALPPSADLEQALSDADGVLRVGPGDLLADALAMRAGIDLAGDSGRGAFLWENRLVRVAAASTHQGNMAVATLSAPPGEPPAMTKSWRDGPPRLLLVAGDAELRAVLGSVTGRCVAVNLPAPEAPSVATVAAALLLEPDVVGVADLSPEQAVSLGGVHAVGWTADVEAITKTMGAASLPPPGNAVS